MKTEIVIFACDNPGGLRPIVAVATVTIENWIAVDVKDVEAMKDFVPRVFRRVELHNNKAFFTWPPFVGRDS